MADVTPVLPTTNTPPGYSAEVVAHAGGEQTVVFRGPGGSFETLLSELPAVTLGWWARLCAANAAIRDAVAAERGRCARICESQAYAHRHAGEVGPDMLCIQAARRIREGGAG